LHKAFVLFSGRTSRTSLADSQNSGGGYDTITTVAEVYTPPVSEPASPTTTTPFVHKGSSTAPSSRRSSGASEGKRVKFEDEEMREDKKKKKKTKKVSFLTKLKRVLHIYFIICDT
jgi:hypothetical protein